MKYVANWLFMAVALAAPSLHGAEELKGKLVLTGSSTVAPLASEIAKRFEQQHSGVRIDVQSGGSGRGVTDVRQGLADMGMVSRGLNPDESDLTPFTIAMDGIGIILNKANDLSALSNAQIVDIYTGKVKNWRELGGKEGVITVVNKAEGRSTLELFLNYFKLKNSGIKAHIVIGDNEQGIKTVAGNPNAIGYVSVGTAEYSEKHGVAIKLLPVGGIRATTASIMDGSYPLSRPLNLVTKQAPTGLAKAFIAFARSSKVNDIVKEQSFVPSGTQATN